MLWSNSLLKLRSVGNIGKRYVSSKKRDFKEVTIKVPWGQVSGKWWEPYDIRPILTFHGWQDNCGSFDRLIPLLNPDVGFLAMDFPGHGYSSKLPQGIYYQNVTYLLTMRCIMDYFKWPKITLMGHSLGGILCYIYTMLYTNEVDFLICLDGVKPMVETNKPKVWSKLLLKFLKHEKQTFISDDPPSHKLEDIVNKVSQSQNNSIKPEYAKYVLERNIAPSTLHEGEFYFTRDPRLKAWDINTFGQAELIQYAEYITCPIFITKAKAGFYYDPIEYFYQVLDVLRKTSIDCDFHHVEGTHHMHLNNPENVAELLVDFIKRHNLEDRSIGGISNEIIVEKKKSKIIL